MGYESGDNVEEDSDEENKHLNSLSPLKQQHTRSLCTLTHIHSSQLHCPCRLVTTYIMYLSNQTCTLDNITQNIIIITILHRVIECVWWA